MATGTGWRELHRPVRAGQAGNASANAALGSTPFARLSVAHLLSAAGDALVTLALAGSLFFSISPSAARGRVALSLVFTMAPFAIVAPFLGPAIDRLQRGRRYIVVVTALGRTVSCVLMAAAVHSLLLFPAALMTLVLSKAHFVAKSALVPAVVDSDDELVGANSKLVVGSAVVGLVAALPGVAILKIFNAAAVLRVGAIVFFITGLAALRIVPAREDRRPPPDSAEATLRTQTIVLAAGVIAVLRATVGFLTFLLAFDLKRHHAAAWWYGLVIAASIGGGLIGAAIAPKLRGHVKEEHMVIGSLLLVVVTGVVAGVVGDHWAAGLMSGVLGLAAGTAKLAFDSLVQRDAHESARGRSFARFEAAFQLVWVVGALAPVLVRMSAETGFVSIAVMTGLAVAAYVAARIRPPNLPALVPE